MLPEVAPVGHRYMTKIQRNLSRCGKVTHQYVPKVDFTPLIVKMAIFYDFFS